MSNFGYEMVSHTREQDGVLFRLRPDVPTEGMKNPVTVIYPDCVANDGKTPAYEKDYVIDLITQITGGNGGKSVAIIQATRHFDA